MAGVTVNEGLDLILEVFYNSDETDRTTLVLGLMQNTSGLSVSSVLADITAVTGTGYSAVTLTDGNWTVSGQDATFASVDFTASGADWDDVGGYYIYTTGGTGTLVHYEYRSGGAQAVGNGEVYRVDLTQSVA